ncbi:MAG: hypothetical protein M3O74_14460, partial [Pseudomonadota bacterium]|nr:hypothetical protein [Pseudomonadota bacterium]
VPAWATAHRAVVRRTPAAKGPVRAAAKAARVQVRRAIAGIRAADLRAMVHGPRRATVHADADRSLI